MHGTPLEGTALGKGTSTCLEHRQVASISASLSIRRRSTCASTLQPQFPEPYSSQPPGWKPLPGPSRTYSMMQSLSAQPCWGFQGWISAPGAQMRCLHHTRHTPWQQRAPSTLRGTRRCRSRRPSRGTGCCCQRQRSNQEGPLRRHRPAEGGADSGQQHTRGRQVWASRSGRWVSWQHTTQKRCVCPNHASSMKAVVSLTALVEVCRSSALRPCPRRALSHRFLTQRIHWVRTNHR